MTRKAIEDGLQRRVGVRQNGGWLHRARFRWPAEVRVGPGRTGGDIRELSGLTDGVSSMCEYSRTTQNR
jgi:hypothetical protein